MGAQKSRHRTIAERFWNRMKFETEDVQKQIITELLGIYYTKVAEKETMKYIFQCMFPYRVTIMVDEHDSTDLNILEYRRNKPIIISAKKNNDDMLIELQNNLNCESLYDSIEKILEKCREGKQAIIIKDIKCVNITMKNILIQLLKEYSKEQNSFLSPIVFYCSSMENFVAAFHHERFNIFNYITNYLLIK